MRGFGFFVSGLAFSGAMVSGAYAVLDVSVADMVRAGAFLFVAMLARSMADV